MGFWRKKCFDTIELDEEVDLEYYLDEEWVQEMVLNYFDTDKLKAEVKDREENSKKYLVRGEERRSHGIKVNHTFSVDVSDVLDEIGSNAIFDEAESRGYNQPKELEYCHNHKLKDILVEYFNINSFAYSDDDILDIVRKELLKNKK